MEVRTEELRRAGLGSRAQELRQALAAIVGLALLEAVRPAVNLDALVEAGLAHGLARDECVRRRALVELHEERRAQRVAPVVGDEMAIADDALAEVFDVALLVRQQGAPRGLRPPACPSNRSPTGPASCGSSSAAPPRSIHSADRPADIRSCFPVTFHLRHHATRILPRRWPIRPTAHGGGFARIDAVPIRPMCYAAAN